MINSSNNLFLSKRSSFIIILILLSIILGIFTSLYEMNVLIFICMGYLLIWILNKRYRLPIAMLFLSAITLEVVLGSRVLGVDPTAMYKLILIFVIFICIAQYGVNTRNIYPIIALCFILFITYSLSHFHPKLDIWTPFNAFFGFISYFLILIVKWDNKLAQKIINTIIFLPLISVVIGFLLDMLGKHSLLYEEYLGAVRLQGANIGAHLAMLAFIGFCVSLIESKRRLNYNTFYIILGLINFFILICTGTRGPLISSIIILLIFIGSYLIDFFRGKIKVIVPLFLFFVSVYTFLILQWDNLMLRTFNNHSGNLGFNLSGRELAWEFFVSNSRGYELFGQGLGSSLVANDGSLYQGFVVPHNEYLRFYFDSGLVGLIIFMISLIVVIVGIGIHLPRKIKVYYLGLIIGFFLYSSLDNTLSTVHFIVPFCFYLSALTSIYNNDNKTKYI